MLADIQKGL